ncbi:DUF6134 family protein [Roseivirga sp.]|uniref:DUF6134 family protein n=1 Tax=Roseivirga sp. TaxID=1964215 RepID=UPI003B8B141D
MFKLLVQVNCYVLFLSLSFFSQAQNLTYDAFIRGHKVGEMSVSREVNDESTKISVKTHIEAHMLVKITVDFESESTYMDNKLIIGEATSHTNGHLKSSVHTVFKDGKYTINKDGKTSSLAKEGVVGADYYYFETPVGKQQTYALATGTMLDIVNNEKKSFYFEHDGKKELHTFENGKLKELEISHRLYTVIFKLRQ